MFGRRLRACAPWVTILGSGVLLTTVVVYETTAQPAVPTTEPTRSDIPTRPKNPRAADAFDVLERRCAQCHQTGRLQTQDAQGRLANILDIEAIAREGNRVRPGRPDASPIYLSMLTQRMPPHGANGNGGAVEPVPIKDIRAIRQWIEELPKNPPTCEGERVSDPEKAATLMRKWLSSLAPEVAQETRFISMWALYNGCTTERERRLYFQAVGEVLNRVSQNDEEVKFKLLGDNGSILAFQLSGIGWTKRDWRVVVAEPPGFSLITQSKDFDYVIADTRTEHPIVPGAWLAERLRHLGELDGLKFDDNTGEKLLGLSLVDGLALRGALPVDLEIGAAELGLKRETLTEKLDQVTGPALAAARYLARGGVLKRRTFNRVARELALGSDEALALEESGELFLGTDKLRYKAGDTAVVHAATTTTCYLTVFGIDERGQTTVLFPNDFDRNNRLVPGREIQVPEPTAPFVLRINNTAPEAIVGVCTPKTVDPPGVYHTFERQRFSILGNWSKFLDTSLKIERGQRQKNSVGAMVRARAEIKTVPPP